MPNTALRGIVSVSRAGRAKPAGSLAPFATGVVQDPSEHQSYCSAMELAPGRFSAQCATGPAASQGSPRLRCSTGFLLLWFAGHGTVGRDWSDFADIGFIRLPVGDGNESRLNHIEAVEEA